MEEEKSQLKVKVAEFAGYCYGVERAINNVEEALKSGKNVYSLGPVIHNPQVVEGFKKRGLEVAENPEDIPAGATVVIRSHGVPPGILNELKMKNVKVIDATCPFVRRAQLVARKLKNQGYQVVVIGETDHPEVIGILGYAGENAMVLRTEDEAESLSHVKKRGVVFQTTQSDRVIDSVVPGVVRNSDEVKIFNTVCEATSKRQRSARKLALESDVVLVIGGRISGNTRRLYDICRSINSRTYHIETSDEIKNSWLDNANTVGITAGASTPQEIIDRVIGRIGKHDKQIKRK